MVCMGPAWNVLSHWYDEERSRFWCGLSHWLGPKRNKTGLSPWYDKGI